MYHHPLRATLAAAGALASAGFVLPEPANVAAFLGSLGLGLGIGLGALIERVGRARASAFKEWDEAHRGSTLAQFEEANRQLQERIAAVDENTRRIQRLETELGAERAMNERLRNDLQGVAMRVLHEKGYIAVQAEPPGPDAKEPRR